MVRLKLRRFIERGLERLNLKRANELVYDLNKLLHAYAAKRYMRLRGKKCLVIGCSRGRDCRYFVRFGAIEVHGVDIIREVGKDFVHPKVTYYRTSCENMHGIPSDHYDLVYCFATMEHVLRIDLAFSEMVRVTRPGGIIYAYSSPLWNSRYGHHRKDLFRDPWLHLLYDHDEIMNYCSFSSVRDGNSANIRAIVNYIFDRNLINRVSAKTYIEVCNNLQSIRIIKNKLFLEAPSVLPGTLKSELFRKEYTEEELLAVSHIFVARKL